MIGFPEHYDARPRVELSSEGWRQVEEMIRIGWKQNLYAIREGCNSCPRCEALASYPRCGCAHCGWTADPEAAAQFGARAAKAREERHG